MIKVDENDPIGEVDPAFSFKDVQIRRGEDVKKYYDLEGEIGRGKFGIVYKCRDKQTKLVLAAKFVSIAKRQDRKNVEREVEIMRTLRHPRLIQLYDAFENQSTMCVVLEMIEGGELFERVIDDDFILTEKACTVFMRQICEGVAFIHSNNIIHLDLKPENILCLTKTGNRIKIIDFGLARIFDPDKKLQVLFGTPEFVAPEVVNFDQISCATDMWSVGVICYVLLSGLSPFMGENDIETMSNVTLGKYDFDDEAFDDISAQAKDFISQLLVKNKEKRLTGEAALVHPWLYRKLPPPPPLLNTSKDNLKNYLDSSVTNVLDQNFHSKLTNRKSMLNAIQILADSEKQFLNNTHKAYSVTENNQNHSDVNATKLIRPEPLRCDFSQNTVRSLKTQINSIYPAKKASQVSGQSEMVNGLFKPESLIELASNQLPFNISNKENIITNKVGFAEPVTVKIDAPTIKRESPLPDTLASLVPINAHIPIACDKTALMFTKSDVTEKDRSIDESMQSTSQKLNEMNFFTTSDEKLNEKFTSAKSDLINLGKQDSKNQTKRTEEKEIKSEENDNSLYKSMKNNFVEKTLNQNFEKERAHLQPELFEKINTKIEPKEPNFEQEMKESIIKLDKNLETMLPTISKSLTSIIEAPLFPSSMMTSSPLNKSIMGKSNVLPVKTRILEISSGSIPSPISPMNKVENEAPKPKLYCLKVDNMINVKENESSLKRNNTTEILHKSLCTNLPQKLNLKNFDSEDKRVNKEKQNSTMGVNLEPLNQTPCPKILGITLGQTSFDETKNMTEKCFTNFASNKFSSSTEFNLFEKTCDDVQKTTLKKESCSKFQSFSTKEHESETVTFKQHLKSIPPWFSESSNLVKSNTLPDKDNISTLSSVQDNSMWSVHSDQLSTRLLEMSKNNQTDSTEETGPGNRFTHNQDESSISWILSKNKNTIRKPKHKFSMMNRDVPIESPQEERGEEFYLNHPFFVVPNGDTQSPQKCLCLSPEKKCADNQCWQNSCHGSILKIVTSAERQKNFTTESTVKYSSSIFNANSKT